MAHGAPDYWKAVQASKSIFSAGQVTFYEIGAETIPAADFKVVINYTVPAGYYLLISGGHVSIDSGEHGYINLEVGGVNYLQTYFEKYGKLPLNPDAPIRADAGETVKLYVFNVDPDVAAGANAGLYGFLNEGS